MELKFETLASTTIKRKKPWPKFAWLTESEPPHGLYLLDNCRISQVSPTTGKTRRKLPSLASIQSTISLLAHSPNGAYLGGLTVRGDMFLWEKETDIVESFVTPLSRMGSESVKADPLTFQGYKLFLSNSGEHALLIAGGSAIFLWELGRERVGPVWWKIFPPDGVLLPDTCNREAAIDACFNTHPVFGKCCSCIFVFTGNNGANNNNSHHHHHDPHTTITHLLIAWPSPTSLFYSSLSPGSPPLHGNHQAFPFSTATDSETSTESRDEDRHVLKSKDAEEGTVRTAYSSGRKQPLSDVTNSNLANPLDRTEHAGVKKEQQATAQKHHVKFDAFLTPKNQPFQTSWSTVFYTPPDNNNQSHDNNNIIINSTHAPLTKRGCYVVKLSPTGSVAALAVNRREASDTAVVFFSPLVDASVSAPLYLSKAQEKTGRSYWVSDMAWLADGLLLACITKRGSLVVLPRFGQPLKLVTHGNQSPQALDVGPAVFLPLHPLITVKGHHNHHRHNLPDHSQSSEVDVLHQRFSVSAHPLHPVLLCSDGYSFTILRLLTRVPLSQLAAGLVLDSRKKLNLSPSSVRPIHDKESSFALKSSLNLGGDVHDFAATLTTDLDATCLDDTLGSTLLSSVAGRDGLFGSLEAGAVQFAGMDSDLELTQSFRTTASNVKKRSIDVAMLQLRAALGQLLSCGKLEPGNGIYPQLRPLKHSEVEKIQIDIQQAHRLLVSTFLTLMETSIVASQTENLVSSGGANASGHLETLFHELFGDILGLAPLDSFNQSHLELVTALINGGLLIMLRSSMQKHKEFASLTQSQPTIQLLKKFADSVCEDISIVSELLDSAVSVLNTTYGMRPLPGAADSAFHAPPLHPSSSKRPHRNRRRHLSSSDNMASRLSISLTTMLELLGAFWRDIQTCGDMANETISGITSNSPQHNRLQLRELGVLYKGLASSLQAAMTVLKASHAQIRQLIQAGKRKGAELQLEASSCEQSQDGNPITLSTNENLLLLLSKLEEYDLKCALELIHSDDILVHSTSFSIPADAGFSLNASTATLSSTISHTHLSLASPSAQPVVACLARVMMAFFSNQKLLISPAAIASTMTGSTVQGDGRTKRLIELKRSEIVRAIREQELSKVWTADCALELALLGGLWEEAAKFVANLGEWKKAILLSLAYTKHAKLLREKVIAEEPNPYLESITNFAHRLALDSIIDRLGLEIGGGDGNEIVPLWCYGKGRPSYTSTCSPHHCTEESFQSIVGTLQVCAAGEMDSVLAKLITSLTGAVTARSQQLPLTVHSSVYLPAPPLYCPQPTIPEEEYIQCPDEYVARYTISHLVHSLVLLLRASNCLHSCAQWYSSELHKLIKAPGGRRGRRGREVFALPGKKLKGLPRALSNLANSGQSLITENDGDSSLVVRLLLACFRQLCGLLWFLHARDQASAHLRKLQPSLSKPDRDADTVQKAALWCCRLLPFARLLAQNGATKSPVNVQLTALSAISELPNDPFFANLSALYFPSSSSLDDRNLAAKFQRLMSRLRSTQDPTSGQLLSVMYQTKSQKVLLQRDAVFGESDGQFQTLISCQDRGQKLFVGDFQNIEVHAQAFDVGCFLFEYDVDYINFLDTLFAVTLQSDSYQPTTASKLHVMLSTSSLSRSILAHMDQPDLAKSPLVSECVKLIKMCDPTDTSPCWQHLLPLLQLLKEWSETPHPQRREWQKSRHSEERLKSNKKSGGGGTVAAMRVNVPLELVVNCLRQEEERMAAKVRRKEVHVQPPSDQPVEGGGRDDKEHTSSSLASVTSCILSSSLSASNIDQTMQMEELERKRETELIKDSSINQVSPLPLPFIEGPANSAKEQPDAGATDLSPTSADTRDHIDHRGSVHVGASISAGSFPLLKVPEGVLQGKLSHEAVQCALMASPSGQSKQGKTNPQPSITNEREGGGEGRREKALEVKKTEAVATVVGGGDSESRGSSVIDDLQLTDSLSTGEFPSDVTFSIGEVGWKLRSRADTPHTTLGAPESATDKDNDNQGGEGEGPEMPRGVELKEEEGEDEADIGQNRSTSTLVNEDSVVLTPTQSSSSPLSAATLTEISQMEGTQSTYTVQLKEGERAHLDKPQKQPTATNETTSQLPVNSDERERGDEHMKKLHVPTAAEGTTSQPLTGEKAAGDGDSVNGDDGDGDVKREERREEEVEEEEGGVELSERLGGIDADVRQSSGPDTNVTIGDIVRSEMKKILEIQHQQLLSLLDSTAAPSASQHPNPTTSTTHTSTQLPPQNIDTAHHDRDSLLHQQSHSRRHRHSSSSSIRSSQIGAELKAKAASTPAKPRKHDLHGVRGGRQKSFRFSDLDTDDFESYDHPGHGGSGINHILSSSTGSTDNVDRAGNEVSKKRRNFEEKIKKKRSSGLFTHTQQFGKHGGIQLLHLESFDREREHSGRGGGQLGQEFPGLPKALKQFNDSIAPKSQQFTSSKIQPAKTIKHMPLLQLPHVPDEAPPLAPPPIHVPKQTPPIAPPTQQPLLHQSTATTIGGQPPMPLLTIPNQPQTISTHPISAGGSVHYNPIPIPPPPPDSANFPTTITHFTNQSSYISSIRGPPVTSSIGRHTAANKMGNIHSLPHPDPAPSGAQHSSVHFQLPQVPVRPFVPILLPPAPSPPPPSLQVTSHGGQKEVSRDATGVNVVSARPQAPQLLQLNDPLSRMKREGFKLLKDDPRDREERVPELKLLHFEERGHPPPPSAEKQQGSSGVPKKSFKMERTREQPPVATDVKQSELLQIDSSDGSLTTISSTTEESSEMVPPRQSLGDGEERERRQGCTGRRQRGRRGKGVAWKMDQEENGKAQGSSSVSVTSSEIDGDVNRDGNKDEKEYPQTLATASEVKFERKPLIGPSPSRKIHSFPDEIPLQRLELRRLDMNASFIPTSSFSPPPPPSSSSLPRRQENIHHVSTTKSSDYQSNDQPSSSPAKTPPPPKTNEIGIQVDPVPVEAPAKEEGGRKTLVSSADQATSYTEPVAKMTISSGVQVSPEHFGEIDGERKVKGGEQGGAVDSIEVTSVSSLDSEEVRVQLSDSDDNDGGLPSTTEQQDEFIPPPLWYNSHSPIPIPTKTEETDSPIPEAEEAAPILSSSHFAGFSATPPSPLPVPLSPVNADSQRHSSPKSQSQSPVPHQQPSVQMVTGVGASRPRPLRSDVMERLHQLEEQLNAIENTAKSVEGEFKTTNQILFTIDRLQAVSDTLTNVAGGSHGDGDVGLLHRDHSQADISPLNDTLSPSPHDRKSGDMRLEDIAGPSFSKRPSQEAEGESKPSRERDKGPHGHHQDAIYLEEEDTNVPERGVHHTDRESEQKSLEKDGGGKGRREKGREELRSWMAAKRRERLAQFLAERDRLRKREKHPFQPPPGTKTGNYSVRGQQQASLLKREQEKEFVAKRIEDAYTLMNDILTSRPTPSPSSHHPHSSTTSPSLPTARLPPNGRGRGGGRGQRRRVASGGQKKVAFSASTGLMKRSQSDSKLYREEEQRQGEDGMSGDELFGGSVSNLHGTYTKNPNVGSHRSRDNDTDLKRTRTKTGLSLGHGGKSPPLVNNRGSQRTPTIRKISSVDGLTEDEQDKIAAILASTDYEGQSVSSGSIVSNIDWEEVDRILDS